VIDSKNKKLSLNLENENNLNNIKKLNKFTPHREIILKKIDL